MARRKHHPGHPYGGTIGRILRGPQTPPPPDNFAAKGVDPEGGYVEVRIASGWKDIPERALVDAIDKKILLIEDLLARGFIGTPREPMLVAQRVAEDLADVRRVLWACYYPAKEVRDAIDNIRACEALANIDGGP